MSETASCIDGINNLPEALFRAAETHSSTPAQWYHNHGEYHAISYGQLSERIKHVASGLIRTGIQAGDRIALLMENRPEWAVLDYAILSIGAVTVPLYCSYRPRDIAHVLNDSGAIIVFTSGHRLLENLMIALAQCPKVSYIYSLDNAFDHAKVRLISDLESGNVEEAVLTQRLVNIDKESLATLAYTSGTTANPKGVMLTHGNIISNLQSVPSSISLTSGQNGDSFLSFLPLAHMLERTGSHFLVYTFALSVKFAERPDTIAKNMMETKPSVMIVVPRMLEVIRNRILTQINTQSLLKQKLFHLYLARSKKSNSGLLDSYIFTLLDQLVGQKIRQRFGGKLRAFISGGAPLSIEVIEFFERIGLPVMEGYGLTESAPLLSVNPFSDRRAGTVGIAAKGVELRIAEDGEILARGSNIMQGYWHNDQASQETLIDGWLQTGDLGSICPDGYLTITGRKKEMIVNSGGENISPQRIESILTVDTQIDQVIIYGDKRPYLIALIVPNEEACIAWAKELQLPESNWLQLCESDALKKHLQKQVNAMLKPLNSFEQVRRIHLLHEPFSIENSTLTPTMKIKRNTIYNMFAEKIATLYA